MHVFKTPQGLEDRERGLCTMCTLGCPFILLRSETKRNGSENELSEEAKKNY